MGRVILGALAIGCAPPPAPVEDCIVDPPAPGEWRVGPIVCAEQIPPDGDANLGDLLLANSTLRAVIRHPESALSLVGHDGGTLVDLATWDGDDDLYEALPIVAGGWLDITSWNVTDDGVEIVGTPRALPGETELLDSTPTSVVWRIDAESPTVHVLGASALRIHPAGAWRRHDSFVQADQWFRTDGSVVSDEGGAATWTGATFIALEAPEVAVQALPGTPTEGFAPGALEIAARAGDVLLGVIPVIDGRFSGRIPAGTTSLRAEAPGRAPSPDRSPGGSTVHLLGAPADVVVSFAWATGGARPIRVDWVADDGRSGTFGLSASGGTLALGAGVSTLTFGAGPAFDGRTTRLELADDAVLPLTVALDRRLSPGSRVACSLDVRADRDRTWRQGDVAAMALAEADGFDFVLATAENDVPSVNVASDGAPRIVAQEAVVTPVPGGLIRSWPWSADGDRPGHGAPDPRGRDVGDLVAEAGGGGRHVAVDLDLLPATPWTWPTSPDLVVLPDPDGDPSTRWAGWWAFLDAGLRLTPAGPVTWAEVDDVANFAAVDVHQALLSGWSAAGTGPVATLTVDGATAGERAPERPLRGGPRLATWEVDGLIGAPTVALLTAGGTILASGTDLVGSLAIEADDWVVLAAWDDAGQWAVTGPVWIPSS